MSYDVFISHASEDKEAVVLPLAEALQKQGFTVWVDAFELFLGDSLRRKIDEGLSQSRYGVVILSHDFFRKEWPQKELDGLVAREDGRDKVILPVWHNLSSAEVTGYSPLLAGKLGVSTSRGIDAVASEIARVLNRAKGAPTPSPVATATAASSGNYASEESRLLPFLEGLTTADFARVQIRVPGSSARIPRSASHYEQVAALVEFAQSSSGIGLPRLIAIVKELFPSFINPR